MSGELATHVANLQRDNDRLKSELEQAMADNLLSEDRSEIRLSSSPRQHARQARNS